jgi:hypothetical protein
MYAADGKDAFSGNLYQVNVCGPTPVVTTVGAIGVGVSGMAFTADGTLYAAETNSNVFGVVSDLFTIDPSTGAGTAIGPLNAGATHHGTVPDITAVGLQLYGWTENGDDFISINSATGAVTVVPSVESSAGAGMAANAAGTIYHIPIGMTPLRTINPMTGISTVFLTLTGAGCCRVNALTWHEGELYGVLNSGPTSVPQLMRIDTTTGVRTVLGDLPVRVDALASPSP